jgi:hypothetical protein
MSVNYEESINEHLEIDSEGIIRGALLGGVTVSSGVKATIYGLLRGPVYVGADAGITIFGMFHGDVLSNDGVLIVNGMLGVAPEDIPGDLAVSIGSVLNHDGEQPFRLTDDGSLSPIPPTDRRITLDNDGSAGICAYDRDRGTFVPVP